MRSTAYLVVLSSVLLVCPASFAEEWGAADEFKLMELQQELRERPQDPQARRWLFAIGESYFKEKNPSAAVSYFRRLDPKLSEGIEGLVASVYLLRCELSGGDVEAARALSQKLQDSLSSEQFFGIFDSTRNKQWRSPLGNQFDLKEEVDRLEIRLNGQPFYTIKLS